MSEEKSLTFKEITRNRAKDWWQSSESVYLRNCNRGICDICDQEIVIGDGYLLYTEEMVRSEGYMKYIDKKIEALEMPEEKREILKGIMDYNIINSPTPWLICDKCILMFVK